MNTRLITLFPLGSLLLSITAYFYPVLFVDAKVAIIPLLALVMFLMGMALT
ncbi:MAG: hypothetical protein GQ548_05525 [Methylophaga sp.]|nr:hypothetical protein [Methylophaga sp.]